jgi:hypothetical protein
MMQQCLECGRIRVRFRLARVIPLALCLLRINDPAQAEIMPVAAQAR